MTRGKTAAKGLPSAETLRQLLDYDAESGLLFWRPRAGSTGSVASFNARFAGKPALNYVANNRHKVGQLAGHCVLAHRVIWKMVTGEEPAIVDHKDGDPLNNRLENLRSTTQSENCKNSGRRTDNTSGATGVHWLKRDKRWSAEIRDGGRKVNLGYFTSFDEALAARKSAEAQYQYSPRHGVA